MFTFLSCIQPVSCDSRAVSLHVRFWGNYIVYGHTLFSDWSIDFAQASGFCPMYVKVQFNCSIFSIKSRTCCWVTFLDMFSSPSVIHKIFVKICRFYTFTQKLLTSHNQDENSFVFLHSCLTNLNSLGNSVIYRSATCM